MRDMIIRKKMQKVVPKTRVQIIIKPDLQTYV